MPNVDPRSPRDNASLHPNFERLEECKWYVTSIKHQLYDRNTMRRILLLFQENVESNYVENVTTEQEMKTPGFTILDTDVASGTNAEKPLHVEANNGPSAIVNTSTNNSTEPTQFDMKANFFVVQKDGTLLSASPLPSLSKFTENDSTTWYPDAILETEIMDNDTVVEEVVMTEDGEREPDSNAKSDMNQAEDEDESSTSTSQDAYGADDSDAITNMPPDKLLELNEVFTEVNFQLN